MTNISNDNKVALDVLKKYDLYCEAVIDNCSRVKLYNYEPLTNSWKYQNNSEGPFFLVRRVKIPFYLGIILCKENKTGSPILIQIPITENVLTQPSNNFIMIKNEKCAVTSIGFTIKEDCIRIHSSLEKILNELRNNRRNKKLLTEPANLFSQPNSSDSPQNMKLQESDKLKSMFENARIRSGSINQALSLVNNADSTNKSRPIDINELFAPLSINKNPVVNADISDKHFRPRTISSPLNNLTATMKSSLNHPHTKPEHNGGYSGDNSCKITTSLTVTELERKLVEDASVTQPKFYEENVMGDDDDETLLQPDQFENKINLETLDNDIFQKLSVKPPTKISTQSVLSKEALKDALIYLLQNDEDQSFISQIHSAYINSVEKKTCHK